MMKISDFGWSVATHLMRETFCGTPLYVSPELLKKNYYNHKIDTWSLGVLAYEILIGQVPFEIFCETDYSKIVPIPLCSSKIKCVSPSVLTFLMTPRILSDTA
jgi:serine/threonine protein kinase